MRVASRERSLCCSPFRPPRSDSLSIHVLSPSRPAYTHGRGRPWSDVCTAPRFRSWRSPKVADDLRARLAAAFEPHCWHEFASTGEAVTSIQVADALDAAMATVRPSREGHA